VITQDVNQHPPTITPKPTRELGRSTLDRHLVSGVAWTGIARFGSQIVTSSALLLQARLLSPADFGIVGMTYILLGFINIVAEFGIGSAILVMRELSQNQIRQIHTVSVLLGFSVSVMTLFAAKPMVTFFHKPELLAVVPVMGLGFALSGFRVVPQSLLARDLHFKTISSIEAATVVLQALSSLLTAWLGMRYWSLVIGGLVGSCLSTALFSIVSPCGFAKPVFRQVREQLAYSQRLLVSRAAWYAYSNADFAVAGRILGESALGLYTMAWNIANAPLDRVVTLILRVTPSVFSSVQHDAAELRRYLRVVTEGMALVVFPVGFGVALVTDAAVSALFDKRWAGTTMPLRLLAICAVLRCIFSVSSQVQTTIRDMRYIMWQSVICLGVLPASFWYGSRWGATGIAAAWLIFYPILQFPALFRTLRKIDMSKREYLKSMAPAGIASMAMAATVFSTHYSLHGSRPLIELISEVVVGAAAYLGILVLLFRSRLDAFLGLVRRSKGSANPSDLCLVEAAR
jgi:O-antigen/teichoic acid export membrane protein